MIQTKVPPMTRPQFGQRIKAKGYVVKQHTYSHVNQRWETVWTKWPWPPEVEGIYIGYRDVHEGGMFGGQEGDDPVYFQSEHTLRVWLIVQNERTNPIHILPEDVIWEQSHENRMDD